MADRNEQRGELPRHERDRSAKPTPKAKPGRTKQEDGRGRDAGRSGSESKRS
jgi:hypothetical protein